MATFMYYPGHVTNPSDQTGPMVQHQQQQQPGYMGGSNQQNRTAYGYYQPPVLPQNAPQPVHSLSQQQHYYGPGMSAPMQHRQPPGMHNHTCSFPQNTMPPMPMFYGAPSAPLLPPLAIEEPVPQEEYVNGGVNQFLDYDLDLIADFVVKNAYIAFGVDPNSSARDTNLAQGVELFTKGVSSVLNATRLPSVTIFLAIDLLIKYISKLPNGCESIGGRSVNVIYQNMMIAFVLANKFNDDKTFTNKSWTQATGMTLSSVNEYEREWLKIFEWRLFEDKFTLYGQYTRSFGTFCQEKRCPSPPNLLPTPHSTDNYLSPLSGFQTPLQMKSNMYSSPCYYDEDSNDFLYSNHSRVGLVNSSPANHISSSVQSNSSAYNCNAGFNHNYYHYALQPPQLPMPSNLGFSPTRSWCVEDPFGNSKFTPQMDRNYYCYSAVY